MVFNDEKPNFDHLEDAFMRKFLTASPSIFSNHAFGLAMVATAHAFDKDCNNEEISFEVLDAREDAIMNAEILWYGSQNKTLTHQWLRKFWSV